MKIKNILVYILFGFVLIFILFSIYYGTPPSEEISFSEFLSRLENGQIAQISINQTNSLVIGKTVDNKHFRTFIIDYPNFVTKLIVKKVEVKISPAGSDWLMGIFTQVILPVLLFAGLWFLMFRQASTVNNQAFSFGRSRVKIWDREKNREKVTFADVAGIDEAKEELEEIVEFLKSPEKFQALGAKIPKGVLLMGPPGSGKTLLARAIAGEADVAFFSLSGSDFVEMFVGVGASRVRDLFEQAKKNMPAIIFVDEVDAVGRHRGAGLGGGHDEREQTLNQLLVEMDGFEPKVSVIVIAATNRPDILDPALLRPGRFDRHIVIDKPDIKGREEILKIHSRDKKLDANVDLSITARRTPGFTGADLANLVNEAALLAARRDKKTVTMEEMEESIERVLAGPQKKSRIISEKEKGVVAYHEVGHALVAKSLPNADPVHKISILPRGLALGYTLQLPIEDRHLIAKAEAMDKITVMLGGRVAEEIVFHEITTGAQNDLEQATDLARKMVCEYGMSDLGPRTFGKKIEHVFLGRDFGEQSKNYGETMADSIDAEVKKIFDQCYQKAKEIIGENKEGLDKLSNILMEREILEGEELDDIWKKLNGADTKS